MLAKKHLIWLVLAVAIWLSWYVYRRPGWSWGVVSITYSGRDVMRESFETTTEDPREVSRVVSMVTSIPKEPCQCAHSYKIIFHRSSSDVVASICDHCFNLTADGETQHYEMPDDLYSYFLKRNELQDPRRR